MGICLVLSRSIRFHAFTLRAGRSRGQRDRPAARGARPAVERRLGPAGGAHCLLRLPASLIRLPPLSLPACSVSCTALRIDSACACSSSDPVSLLASLTPHSAFLVCCSCPPPSPFAAVTAGCRCAVKLSCGALFCVHSPGIPLVFRPCLTRRAFVRCMCPCSCVCACAARARSSRSCGAPTTTTGTTIAECDPCSLRCCASPVRSLPLNSVSITFVWSHALCSCADALFLLKRNGSCRYLKQSLACGVVPVAGTLCPSTCLIPVLSCSSHPLVCLRVAGMTSLQRLPFE